MKTWIRLTWPAKWLWSRITGRDLVYVKDDSKGEIWLRLTRRRWDPFVEQTPVQIRLEGKLLTLLIDGTIREPGIKLPPGMVSAYHKDRITHRWMHVDINKRTMMNLRGEDQTWAEKSSAAS